MIHAAPFAGEFGWHVALWVPWLRWMALRHYKPDSMLVFLHDMSLAHLYEDFAEVKHLEMPSIDRFDCQHVWVNGTRLRKEDYTQLVLDKLRRKAIHKRDIVTPLDMPVQWPKDGAPRVLRAWNRPYGKPLEKEEKWVGIHARSLPDKSPERNFDAMMLERLLRLLWEDGVHVLFFGAKIGSLYAGSFMQGESEDLRGLPMNEVTLAMSKCQCVVGPSSGPLALAMQCVTPVLWWSENDKDVERYAEVWNPWKLPNTRIEKSWKPSHGTVHAGIRSFLSRPSEERLPLGSLESLESHTSRKSSPEQPAHRDISTS